MHIMEDLMLRPGQRYAVDRREDRVKEYAQAAAVDEKRDRYLRTVSGRWEGLSGICRRRHSGACGLEDFDFARAFPISMRTAAVKNHAVEDPASQERLFADGGGEISSSDRSNTGWRRKEIGRVGLLIQKLCMDTFPARLTGTTSCVRTRRGLAGRSPATQ